MTKFNEQMERLHEHDNPQWAGGSYANIFPNDDWDITDYKAFTYYLKAGYLVQDYGVGFSVNEEWEWDDDDEKDWENI